jgi:Arc/MetJ-type ribon-helix-helix transcriptional regulator
MPSAQIGIKVDQTVKEKIDQAVAAGKYRHISDFMHRAIAAELERGGVDSQTYIRKEIISAIKNDPEVIKVFLNAWVKAKQEDGWFRESQGSE